MRAPRAFACSYSSSTRTPAPSPSTKPSRSTSHGRLAVAGSSLRVDSARAAQKPPMPSALTVASAPPAIMTSASPYSISRAASPMLWFAVEHARDDREVRALKAVVDRHEARDHVDDRARHEERRDLAHAAGVERVLRVLDQRQAADAGADADADALLVARVVVETGVGDRLHRRHEAVVDERVVAPRFLRRQVLRRRRSPSPRRRCASETSTRRSG